MKKSSLALCLFYAALAAAQGGAPPENTNLSPAENEISQARKVILGKPTEYTGYSLLATALLRSAHETFDDSIYAQAEAAVNKSLELAPNNFDSEKLRASILLAEHDYPAALEIAKDLNKRVPDDVMVYGLLTDANVELGNYKGAEDSAQWMLNLRPGNLPALTRAAHLRELFGDPEGALDLFDLAYQSTPPTDNGERASILTQMGHLHLASGNTETAEKFFGQALQSFRNYPPALGNLAQLRIAQKRYSEAVPLLQQRYQSEPRAKNLYDLAGALQLAGRSNEAQKAFTEFETKSLTDSRDKDNSNHELVFHYADHAHQPAKALEVAQREFAWRHDVYTLDAYAWALHINGKDPEARKQIETALAIGIHDSRIFLHAGKIALSLRDFQAAEHYLKQAAEMNAVESEQARSMLARLTAPSAR
jgi:tetratricopeptide (TPR) repeat protein